MTRGGAAPSAYAAALRLLTGRALTSGELAARLARRGFPPEEVAAAESRLRDLGYLDDRRTAAAWAEAAARVRGLGPARVRRGLLRRRIGRELAAEALAGAFGPGEEERLAGAALERRERARGPVTAAAQRRAAYAWLRGRGFSPAACRAALFNRGESE